MSKGDWGCEVEVKWSGWVAEVKSGVLEQVHCLAALTGAAVVVLFRLVAGEVAVERG